MCSTLVQVVCASVTLPLLCCAKVLLFPSPNNTIGGSVGGEDSTHNDEANTNRCILYRLDLCLDSSLVVYTWQCYQGSSHSCDTVSRRILMQP